METNILRSPFFYVGDKFKLIKEIRPLFPEDIERFIEPFVGGGSVFMNVKADEFLLNDIDTNVIQLHKFLCKAAKRKNSFYKKLEGIIRKYGLSYSYKEDVIPKELKQLHKKTYFAKYNKDAFNKMRGDYNAAEEKDLHVLYLLLIYGFNRMLRFNKDGHYNLPVGNVDFNENVFNALESYFSEVLTKKPKWYNMDYKEFIKKAEVTEKDFIYLDPPYLITFSEYNKLWNESHEIELLNLLDKLNEQNIRFAISNVTHYKGRVNEVFVKWAQKYTTHSIKSNYISYHDNTIKEFNEVLITNY